VVNKDPVKKITRDLMSLLSRWKKKNYISEITSRSLSLSDGMLPRAYGLPKIHKSNCPLRIIISYIDSPLHAFATYLHNILYKNLPRPASHIANSYELVEKLGNVHIDDQTKLFSLDVVSLFTNVPLDLVFGCIAKKWHLLQNKIKIPYSEFIIGLRLIMNSTFFKFNGKVYKQIFGTPMGSPLSPILADLLLVMEKLEETTLFRLPFHIPLYVRYVDDIAIAAPSCLIPNILNMFNSFHKRLQFTIEVPEMNSLNFLDITLIVNGEHLEFNWFRKSTFLGRFLNFYSGHPLIHKKGVIIGLVDKILKLLHPRYHAENLVSVINILLHNSYPIDFIFGTIHNRIKYLISNSNIPEIPSQATSPCPSFFTIPYIKNFSEIFHVSKKLRTLAFTVKNKLNTVVKLHKDSLTKMQHSNIVYKLSCSKCEASYVGQTKRQLKTRINEDEKNINLRNEDLNVISIHRLQGHDFNWSEAKILDKEPSYKKKSFRKCYISHSKSLVSTFKVIRKKHISLYSINASD